MEKFLIKGRARLSGEVVIGGAKNAAVAIIPATVLAQGRCVLENIPDISDVKILLSALKEMGAKVEHLSKSTIMIDTSHLSRPVVPYELARQMRGSYYFLAHSLDGINRPVFPCRGAVILVFVQLTSTLKGLNGLGQRFLLTTE